MMTSSFPIILKGVTLGERHRNFNIQVREVNVDAEYNFDILRNMPENSPLDRLYKIDVASLCKNENFIIENLKSEDMLFVTRALKSTWLLDPEYTHIINPNFLEGNLFKYMTTVAINKMRHWLHAHLRNETQCLDFYKYYKKDNFNLAIKFLPNCLEEYVCDELNEVANKLTPGNLEMLIKKYPRAAQVFFHKLGSDDKVTKLFLSKRMKYFETIKYVLNSDAELFFDIVEKYNNFYPFKAGMTKKIMRKHKCRVLSKIEFYLSKILDIKTVVQSLSDEEVKEILMRLTRAKYLESWFCYKNIELLIKRLNPQERNIYRKMLFVNKSIDGMVDQWPYDIPKEVKVSNKSISDIFVVDPTLDPKDYYDNFDYKFYGKKIVRKRKYQNYSTHIIRASQTNFDTIFDKYRFVNFEKSLHELITKLKIESDSKNRLNMMLVLISKSSADVCKMKNLLELFVERHINEPDNVRAAVVRSFVKRCNAWRLPEDCWELLLKFGRCLGLDGKDSEEICVEGIHANLLRNILHNNQSSSALLQLHLKHFSTFVDYKLNSTEKKILKKILPNLLLEIMSNKNVDYNNMYIFKYFDVLDAYKIDIRSLPDAVSIIMEYCNHDDECAKLVIQKLYSRKAFRKELIDKYFEINQNDESLLNALRHKPSLLKNGQELLQCLSRSDRNSPQRFLRSLVLYFGEDNGLAEIHTRKLKEQISLEILKNARSLAILSRNIFNKTVADIMDSRLSTKNKLVKELYDNMLKAKVFIDFEEDWKPFGTVAVANQVLICSQEQIKVYLPKLKVWRKTAKLALILAERYGCLVEIFKEMAEVWPSLIVKMGFTYLKKEGDKIDLEIWKTIKTLCEKASGKLKQSVEKNIVKIITIPLKIKEDFCALAFLLNPRSAPNRWRKFILCHLNNCMPGRCDEYLTDYLFERIEIEWSEDNIDLDSYYPTIDNRLYVNTIAKLLMMCDSETQQRTRLESIGKAFYYQLDKLWATKNHPQLVFEILDMFLSDMVLTEVFLSPRFVSPLPVLIQIQEYNNKLFEEERILSRNLKVKLTILYYKSLRESLKKNPEVYADTKIRVKAFEIIGVEFGRNIAVECDRLIDEYFKSILEIFKNVTVSYINDMYNVSIEKVDLTASVCEGILKSLCCEDSKILAVHILHNAKCCTKNTVNLLKEEIRRTGNTEMIFMLNAGLD